MQNRWIALVLLLLALPPASLSAQDQGQERYTSPWRTPWTYEQAGHWSDLDPQYALCNSGKAQSPIDIRNAQKADLPPLQFAFKSAPLRYVTNNRYTIRVNDHDAPGTGSLLTVGGRRYQLTQFHFHHPSEERIDGKPYEMEAHLMYQAADGAIAGVAVFITSGAPNHTMQQLWQHMPRAEGQVAVTGVVVNPADLVPRNLGYYSYTGSQTAPPCAEPVTWFVVRTPIEASPEQINAFAELFPHDARPVQPLNGRVVKESQ